MSEPMEILDGSECWRLLRLCVVGRLGVLVGGVPEIFPVNYLVDHGSVLFRTAEGTKLAAAIGGPVAFEADGCEEGTSQAWSVVLKGHAREVTGVEELLSTLGAPLFPWHDSPKPRFVRIEPDAISGRRFHVTDPSVWTSPPTGVRLASSE